MNANAETDIPSFDALSQLEKDRIVALHEAAHAVIGTALDGLPEWVVMREDDANGNPCCLWHPRERAFAEADDYARLRALVAIAGPIGTGIVYEDPARFGAVPWDGSNLFIMSSSDIFSALEQISSLTTLADDDTADVDAVFAEFSQEVEGLLTRYEPAWRSIADDLLIAGSLTSMEIWRAFLRPQGTEIEI